MFASPSQSETDDGFVLLAGWSARRTPTGAYPVGYLALREQLVSKLSEGTVAGSLYVHRRCRIQRLSAAARANGGWQVPGRHMATGVRRDSPRRHQPRGPEVGLCKIVGLLKKAGWRAR